MKIKNLLFLFILLPAIASGQIVGLKSAKKVYSVGDSFSVSLNLNTQGRSINAVNGSVYVDPDFLRIIDVRYGESFLSLWVEKPVIDRVNGIITFTGGVPNGYNGSDGPILSFGVKALKVGNTTILPKDIKALLNDGEGTEADISISKIDITIEKAVPKPVITPGEEKVEAPSVVYIPPSDTAPPESFIPLVSQHESIGDGKYFVVFSTTDKGSGISHYLVSEHPWFSPFGGVDLATSTSPYILSNQIWINDILVRAYDLNGNYIEGRAVKSLHPVVVWLFAILVSLVSVLFTRFMIKRDKRKYRILLDKIVKRK